MKKILPPGATKMVKMKWAIPAIVLVLGIVVLGACKSGPKPATVFIEYNELLMPDDQSAVVYFCSQLSQRSSVWDGEEPIGCFDEKGISWTWITIMHKTTPGEHYFMFNGTNWVVMRAELKANKRYIVIVSSELTDNKWLNIIRADEGHRGLADLFINHKYAQLIVFPDTWRADFLNENGVVFQEAQGRLQNAKNEGMEVTLIPGLGF